MKRILIVIMLAAGSPAMGQDTTLRLSDAVRIALKNNLEIQIADNNITGAGLLNTAGFAGALPVVTGTISDNQQLTNVNQKLNNGNNIQRNNAGANSLNSTIAGTILLYNGGLVTATRKRLNELERQSRELLNSQVQNTIAAVMLTYYDIVRQQDFIRTLDSSISASNEQLHIVTLRREVGLANNADLFQAQIDLNVLKQTRLAQELIVAQAKTEMLRLLSVRPDSSISVRDTILIDRSLQLDSVLNSLYKNPVVIAADFQIRINELIVRETRALRYPAVSANLGYGLNRNQVAAGNVLLNQNYGPVFGLGLSVPIFNGSILRRRQRVAEIDVTNAGLQRDIIMRDYKAQAVSQFQAYTNTLSQLDTAQKNFELSQKLLDLTLLRFSYKQATAVEVRNAQFSFQESGFRLTNLNFVAKAAEIELKRLSNKLVVPVE